MREKTAGILRQVSSITNKRKKEVYRDWNKTPRNLRGIKMSGYIKGIEAKV